jgi:hypothetical protein
MKDSKNTTKPSLKHIIKSVFGAFIGVQNSNHAVEDFKYGNLTVFVIAGIVGVLILIGIIIAVVKGVLA